MTSTSGHSSSSHSGTGLRLSTLVVGLIMVLLVIAQAVATGFAGLLGSAGLIALCTGLYSLLTSRPSWLGFPNWRIAAIVGLVGLVASLIATAIHWR